MMQVIGRKFCLGLDYLLTSAFRQDKAILPTT